MSNKLKIHVTGASGSGCTTLGKTLAEKLDLVLRDVDDYIWHPTEPQYRRKRSAKNRENLLLKDLKDHDRLVLCGSLVGSLGRWGDFALPYFDLIIFLFIPADIRMDRLKKRENERMAREGIVERSKDHKIILEFLEKAEKYDKGDTTIRSKKLHEEWLNQTNCPVLRLEGSLSNEERVQKVLIELKKLNLL